MFLAYTPVEELPTEDTFTLATDIALAAATGENIFNFGEVLATPILQKLIGTPNEWLHDLVVVLNRGDIDAFNALVNRHSNQFYSQPILASKYEDVKKKIILLCLMNIIFERDSHDRTISFSDIASRTKLQYNEVIH
jgi:26S proteasome regulatory subunit N9